MESIITTKQIISHINGFSNLGVHAIINSNILPAKKIGGTFIIHVSDYLKFIRNNPTIKLTNIGQQFIEQTNMQSIDQI